MALLFSITPFTIPHKNVHQNNLSKLIDQNTSAFKQLKLQLHKVIISSCYQV